MADETTTTPGTDPVADAGGVSGTDTTPPEGSDLQAKLDALQAKYEANLERLTPLEEAARERDQLRQLINERLETNAPPAQPDEITTRQSRFEQSLWFSYANGSEAEKDMAASLLGLFGYTRGLAGQFEEKLALAPLDEPTRKQVQQVMKEAADQGNRITPAFARQLIQTRSAMAELEKLKAQPQAPPPNTRVVPNAGPVNGASTGTITYEKLNSEWATATPQRKDELRALERAGKVVPG